MDLSRPSLPTHGAVHVWEADLDDPGWAPSGIIDQDWLDNDETARLQRLKPPHRQRFLVGRGLRQLVVARYLRVDPSHQRFATGVFGKPEAVLPDGHPPLHIGISHCRNAFVLALAAHPIGIDIERLDPDIDLDGVAKVAFSDAEQRCLDKADRSLRLQAFYKLWTGREARLKALGLGWGAGNDISAVSGEDMPELVHHRRGSHMVAIAAGTRWPYSLAASFLALQPAMVEPAFAARLKGR